MKNPLNRPEEGRSNMKKLTEELLKSAFSGESQAHMRYLIFAEMAEKEGFNNLARLFKGIAYAEFVHARNHLKALNLVKRSDDNLYVAIIGETYEVEEMYPGYKAVAQLQEERSAIISYNYAYEAERIHVELYKRAKGSIGKGRDIDIRKIWICPVCGHTHIGDEPPDRCPICGARKELYVSF
jgi:rubrerythrin